MNDDDSIPNDVLRLIVDGGHGNEKKHHRTAVRSSTGRPMIEGMDDNLIKIIAKRSHNLPITEEDLLTERTISLYGDSVPSIDFTQRDVSSMPKAEPEPEQAPSDAPGDFVKVSNVANNGPDEYDEEALPGAYSGAPGVDYGRIQQAPLPPYLMGDASHREREDPTRSTISERRLEDIDCPQEESPDSEIPGERSEEGTPVDQTKKQLRLFRLVAGVVLVVFATVLASTLQQGASGGGVSPDSDNQPSQDIMLVPNLTNFSLKALQDPDSYQSLAYSWVENDPDWDMYESWRKQQRFALVVVYFAFAGPMWSRHQVIKNRKYMDWLSHDECKWQSSHPLDTCDSTGRLKVLDLSGHFRLKGIVPSEVSFLSHLETIDFSGSDIRGDLETLLPLEANNTLPALKTLDLSEASLSGDIPSTVGLISTLTTLHLCMNEFNSAIPSELGLLSHLTSLDLSRNNLSGRIPDELGDLTALSAFSVDNNLDLAPYVPEGFCREHHSPMDHFGTSWCSSLRQCCMP